MSLVEPRIRALAEQTRTTLPDHVHRFFAAGSGMQVSAGEAEAAWQRHRFSPHVLTDVTQVDTGCRLVGQEMASPLLIAPTSMQRWAHEHGEVEMALGAVGADTTLVIPSHAGSRFSEVAATGVRWWLQVYLTADRRLIGPVIHRALEAGAEAVVLTVDTPWPGPKPAVPQDAAFGELTGVYGVNHPEFVRGQTPGAEHAADLTVADLERLVADVEVPVIAKGVLRGDDARRCTDAGAAAVWVSNHGGRQLDRSRTSCDALPEVVAAIGGAADVIVDGGVRSGLDMLTALALGSTAVAIGRPALWALAQGRKTVADLCSDLAAELAEALALAGCTRPEEARAVLAR